MNSSSRTMRLIASLVLGLTTTSVKGATSTLRKSVDANMGSGFFVVEENHPGNGLRELSRLRQRRLNAVESVLRMSHDQDEGTSTSKFNHTSNFRSGGYAILSSSGIFERLRMLAVRYDKLCTLDTSQNMYDLPAAGSPIDCTFDLNNEGCHNYVFTIEDKLGIGSASSADVTKYLPEVYFSGELHGDERVGPTVLVETAELLLKAADCESKPEGDDGNCRRDMESTFGVDRHHRQWLARLVSTRRIVMTPMTNALGYDQNVRFENGIDPNRDFPYDREDKRCMETITARTVNELFRHHLFQMSLTFHAGTECIAYAWGNPTYNVHGGSSLRSPDDMAKEQIAFAYSNFAGGLVKGSSTEGKYKYGTVNDLVYHVHGGMEDWAYAASWDRSLSSVCSPDRYQPYPEERTTYSNSTFRVFNMLVETSSAKTPMLFLGDSRDLFNPASVGNGHVSRNIRLALLGIELVQPYVRVTAVDGSVLRKDTIPGSSRALRSCENDSDNEVKVSNGRGSVTVRWTVGGALTVAATSIIAIPWDHLPREIFDCHRQPTQDDLDSFAQSKGVYVQDQQVAQQGFTRWSVDGPFPVDDAGYDLPPGPVFHAAVDIAGYPVGARIALIAMARVDDSWGTQPSAFAPMGVSPQSHIVNARTNLSWKHDMNGKGVRGRKVSVSTPVTMVIGSAAVSDGDNGAVLATTGAEHNGSVGECAMTHDAENEFQVLNGQFKRCAWIEEVKILDPRTYRKRCIFYGQKYCPCACNHSCCTEFL